MPRLTTIEGTVFDLCRSCWPQSLQRAQEEYGDEVDYTWLGNEHPDYDSDAYVCAKCERPLTVRDD